MTDNLAERIASAVVECFDATEPARVALHPLMTKPERPRWWEFLSPLSFAPVMQRWQASQPSAQAYEAAAVAADELHDGLTGLLAVFPDAPLRSVAAPSSTWKARIWTAEATTDLIMVGLEIDAATTVITELYAQLNRGMTLRPRNP